MDNQQLNSNLRLIIRNAIFGDGCLWKHPECVNYKMVFTSSDKYLLERKKLFVPNLFTGNINFQARKGNITNYGKRSKDLYNLASRVHPLITEYKKRKTEDIINELTLSDFALWYPDDGCSLIRKDGGSYRFLLCIGNVCNTNTKQEVFTNKLIELFGSKYGKIDLNNSKATINNKTWIIPNKIAFIIFEECINLKIESYRIPYNWKKFNDYLERE